MTSISNEKMSVPQESISKRESTSEEDDNYMELYVEKEIKDKLQPVTEKLELYQAKCEEEQTKLEARITMLEARLPQMDIKYEGIFKALL